MKKVTALLLCIAMLASLCCTSVFAASGSMSNFVITQTYTDGMFTDVNAEDWFAADVAAAYGYNLMIGQSADLFGSSANITIGEVIALASKIHYTYYGMTLNLSGSNPWYKSYVTYAINNNIIEKTDYADYTLDATREQMAKIIYKALPNEALPSINDIKTGEIPDVSSGAVSNYLYTLYRAGIISGRNEAGRFYPNEKIMRCECAAIAARMADKSLRVTFKLDATKDFIETNPNLGPAEGSGNIATEENLLTTVNDLRQTMYFASRAVDQAYALHNFPIGDNPQAVTLKLLEDSVEYCKAGATKAKEAALFCKDHEHYAAAYTPLLNTYNVGASFSDAVSVVVADILDVRSSTPKQKAEHWRQVREMAELMQDNATKAYNYISGVQR